MDVELAPEQPPQVAAAVAALLERASPRALAEPGPWWRAGLAEALAARDDDGILGP